MARDELLAVPQPDILGAGVAGRGGAVGLAFESVGEGEGEARGDYGVLVG